MSQQSTPEGDDRFAVKSTNTEWGPKPGDATQPPPTPQAPEIPMSKSWPWVAGGAVALVYLGPAVLVLVVIIGIIGLVAHWW
jgi:hypothetical protein